MRAVFMISFIQWEVDRQHSEYRWLVLRSWFCRWACGPQIHSCAADRSLNDCCIRGGNAGDAYPNHRYALGSGRETSAVYPTDSPTHSRGNQKTGAWITYLRGELLDQPHRHSQGVRCSRSRQFKAEEKGDGSMCWFGNSSWGRGKRKESSFGHFFFALKKLEGDI